MNLGLGSGGSIIHTEMMQGLRPSGATSEQLTDSVGEVQQKPLSRMVMVCG